MEEKPYDVLLDSVPWSYSMVKYPFQEKLIRVNWRN
ncbi:contractile injection system tape measure protein [Parabacteroides goldsteinii]|nr:contractile injection system tape measure protein [Parabacteroides goldsteinii]